ncbi:condensation domain-containing protein [Serratia marcescens]
MALETLDADCDVGKLINAPFDLREGPLCRFYLIEQAPQRYNLIIVVHHILIDGLSGQEFYSAVSAYYNRGTAVTPPQADETDISTLYRRYEADIAALKHEFGSASFWGDMLAECARAWRCLISPAQRPKRPAPAKCALRCRSLSGKR